MKVDLVNDHLAGKEMEIGRFYEDRHQWLAASMRFRTVIDKYQTTSHTPEALMRLTETYLALGVREEAQRSAAVRIVPSPPSTTRRSGPAARSRSSPRSSSAPGPHQTSAVRKPAAASASRTASPPAGSQRPLAALAMTLGGCVSVTELEQSRETLDVISGKSPRAYADCVKQKLADTREPLVEEQRGDGLRLIEHAQATGAYRSAWEWP